MLQKMALSGRVSKVRRRRAHILLVADEDRQGGTRSDADILGAGPATSPACAGNAPTMRREVSAWEMYRNASAKPMD